MCACLLRHPKKQRVQKDTCDSTCLQQMTTIAKKSFGVAKSSPISFATQNIFLFFEVLEKVTSFGLCVMLLVCEEVW